MRADDSGRVVSSTESPLPRKAFIRLNRALMGVLMSVGREVNRLLPPNEPFCSARWCRISEHAAQTPRSIHWSLLAEHFREDRPSRVSRMSQRPHFISFQIFSASSL